MNTDSTIFQDQDLMIMDLEDITYELAAVVASPGLYIVEKSETDSKVFN